MAALETGSLDDGDEELMKMLDKDSDLGVGDYQHKSMAELGEMLGIDAIQRTAFPYFSTIVSDLSKDPGDLEGDRQQYSDLMSLRPDVSDMDEEEAEEAFAKWDEVLAKNFYRRIWPRWHQLVGLTAMLARFYTHKNVLLADGVGVGKTMQAFMAMAYLRYCKFRLKNGQKPIPPFRKSFPFVSF